MRMSSLAEYTGKHWWRTRNLYPKGLYGLAAHFVLRQSIEEKNCRSYCCKNKYVDSVVYFDTYTFLFTLLIISRIILVHIYPPYLSNFQHRQNTSDDKQVLSFIGFMQELNNASKLQNIKPRPWHKRSMTDRCDHFFFAYNPFRVSFDSFWISRFVIILSIIPYLKASSLPMKKSRSVS